MNVDELYVFFDSNWCKIARELKLGVNTVSYWRKIGYIPMATQLKIQKATVGKLVADINK